MADYGIAQGLERASGNALNVGMGMMQMQVNQRHQQALEKDSAARLIIAQEQGKREQTSYEYTEKKRIEQENLDNSFTPASLAFPKIHEFPKLKTMGVDALRKAGFEVKETADGEIYTTNKGYTYLNTQIKNNPTFAKTTMDATIEDLQTKSITIGKKIAEIQESGKVGDKTLPVLQQQQLSVKAEIAKLFSTQEAFLKEEQKFEHDKKLKQMEIDKARVDEKQKEKKLETTTREKTLAQAKSNIAYNQKERTRAEKALLTEEDPARKEGWKAAIKGFNDAIDDNNSFINNEGRVTSAKDKYGYRKDEVRKGHKYIGNDKWEKL